MLDFDTALELLNKYGYTSISIHPFVYQSGDSIGVCYTFEDEDYGILERIRIFDNVEEFEEFLRKYHWYQKNGKNYHVRMILDNYEAINPKTIYLRNEKIMVEGEMFDIDNYDLRESQRSMLDDVSKVIYEAGDLLLVYDEIKGRQLQYLKNLIKLKNTLRRKYYELQLEVDKYNKFKVERNLTLLPELTDSGINEMMEITTKDKYNMYVAQSPSYEEAVIFIKEVWELILNLELNMKYYEAQKEETDIRNELKIVEKKISLMKNLNENLKPLFGVDLVSKFRKINRSCKNESSSISNEFIQERIEAVNRKYSFFEQLDLLYTSDYLREAIQNTNYNDLVLKYAKGNLIDRKEYAKKPPNEIAANLSIQYKENLDISEQAILVLYNNHKFRKLCDVILNIDGFELLPIKQIIKKLSGISRFSKIKSECYDIVKKRINEPINQVIKNSLFVNYDFTSFETFIASLVKELSKLKNINNKMILNGDINMYLTIDNIDDVSYRKFITVTNDLNFLYAKSKENSSMIGLILLKKNLPVLYSPYYFDLGDIYSKNASPQMMIKEMVNFELLIDNTDIIINIDPNKETVVKYYTEAQIVDNVSIVNDIKMSDKTVFCKFVFNSNIANQVVTPPVSERDFQNVSMSSPMKMDNESENSTLESVNDATESRVDVEQPNKIVDDVKVDTEDKINEVTVNIEDDGAVDKKEVINNESSNIDKTEIKEKTDASEKNKQVVDVTVQKINQSDKKVEVSSEEKNNRQVTNTSNKDSDDKVINKDEVVSSSSKPVADNTFENKENVKMKESATIGNVKEVKKEIKKVTTNEVNTENKETTKGE